MTEPFEFHGVEAEKAEAMRKYNNRRSFRNILRAVAVASLCYFWFPTVAISLQAAGNWIYRTGADIITDRSVIFVFANVIVALVFILSGESNDEYTSSSSNTEPEPDLYDRYTSSAAAIVTDSVSEEKEDDSKKQTAIDSVSDEKVVEEDESNKQTAIVTVSDEKVVEDDGNDDDSSKQIVPAFIAEVVDQANREAVKKKRVYRRTKSEAKNEIFRPVMEYRRTESAKVVAMERLNSEEFRLKVEAFITEKKRSLVYENDVVEYQGLRSI